jgi:hypothetical protein
MTDIVIPTTQVADTGTGATMVPYRLAGDIAVYREASPVAQAAVMQLRRTEPKPTKDYAGAAKGTFKFTRQYADTLGRLWPAVYDATTSVPVFLTDAQKAAFVLEATLVLGLAVPRDALAKLVIPQS